MDQSAELLGPVDATPAPPRGRAAPGADPKVEAQAVEWPGLTTLKVCAVGLAGHEQMAFEQLLAAQAPDMPQLLLLEPKQAGAADVVLIDGRTEAARAWWPDRQNDWRRRPVVWIDQQSPHKTHTTVFRPIVWPALPLILSRAAQVLAPPDQALVAHRVNLKQRAVVVVCPKRMASARLRWMLDGLGYRATVAESAQEGLAALHAAPYDAVVLADPDGGGLDVTDTCRRIRSLQRRVGRLPVLVLANQVPAWQRLQARLWADDVSIAPWPARAEELQALLRQQSAPQGPSRRGRSTS